MRIRRFQKLAETVLKYHARQRGSPACVTERLILDNTEESRDHMTPEITLHLITRCCQLWHEKGDKSPFVDPFWAFYWPGGQVLTW